MVGSSVERLDAEPDESGIEPTEGFGDLEGGAEGVIAEDRVGHAMFGEGVPEHGECGFHAEVGTDLESDEEARVVVEDGEGVDLLAGDLKRPFEVALPEVVGLRPLEAEGLVGGQGG
jgi:hypothetical protein